METHSRSYLLVQQELGLLQENMTDLQIVNVEMPSRVLCLLYPPATDDHWKESRFYINIFFHQNFPFSPPSFRFLTIPFHPNVDPVSGECIFERLRKWNSRFHVIDAIQDLLNILAHPDLKDEHNILNDEARDLCVYSPEIYSAMARQCARNSQNLGDLMASQDFVDKFDLRYSKERTKAFIRTGDVVLKSPSSLSSLNVKDIIRQVGFEEYRKSWSAMGTTKFSGKVIPKPQLHVPSKIKSAVSDITISSALPRSVSVGSDSTRVMKTTLKLKLDSFMTSKGGTEGCQNSLADVESLSTQGRAPSATTDIQIRGPVVITNTPIREESPPPSNPPEMSDTDSKEITAASLPSQTSQKPANKVHPITRENKDFIGQMPSQPGSQEKKHRYRSDEPIFDISRKNTQSDEGDTLLEWTKSLK